MSKELVITIALVILSIMFNTYMANILADYDNKPDYYKCNNYQCNPEETIIGNNINKVRESYDFIRDNYLLSIGITTIIVSRICKISHIRNGFSIAGLMNIFYVMLFSWSTYDEKTRLLIIGSGIITLIAKTI